MWKKKWICVRILRFGGLLYLHAKSLGRNLVSYVHEQNTLNLSFTAQIIAHFFLADFFFFFATFFGMLSAAESAVLAEKRGRW